MDEDYKRRVLLREQEPLADEALQESPADARRRQKAASYLRAANLADDPAERERLRRQAADLVAPRRRRPPTRDEDETG